MAKSKIQLENNQDGHKELLFDFLLKDLIDKLIIYFDGGGDDGGINDIEAVGIGSKNWNKISKYQVKGARIKHNCGWSNGKENFAWREDVTLEDIVYDICYRVLNKSFGGWENDDGSCGEFVIDAKRRKIILTMKQRYYEYEVSEHEL